MTGHREYVYQISPTHCEHQGQQVPWHDDIVYYEEPEAGLVRRHSLLAEPEEDTPVLDAARCGRRWPGRL